MKALILAAGRGSRMKQMTTSRPKCLVHLGTKTLLDWQTLALKEGGVSSITLVKGYQKECLNDLQYISVENPLWQETNMVYSLFCAQEELLQNTHLISYSDIVYHTSIIQKLKQAQGDIIITYDTDWLLLWSERFVNPLDDAETFSSFNGQLQSIGKKAKTVEEIQGQYMGLLKVTPRGFAQMKKLYETLTYREKKELDMTSFLQKLLESNIPIHTLPIQGKWCEVDNEEDLLLYHKKLDEPSWHHNWK